MPLGTPEMQPQQRQYQLILNHKTIQPGGDLVVTLEYGDMATEPNTDQCIQDLIDLVNGSEHFLVAVARKTTPSVEQISATA